VVIEHRSGGVVVSSVNVGGYGIVAVMGLLLLAATGAVLVGFRARGNAAAGTASPPPWQLAALTAIVALLWIVALSNLRAFVL
jgi:hypothetical protein